MRAVKPARPSTAPHQGCTRAWLEATGSLTARLRRHGQVRVQVLRQGPQHLWPEEARALGHRHGHVREVLLWVDDRPAVWARSCTSLHEARGAWRAIKGLGNRPLAEILFNDTGIQRTTLHRWHWPAHGRPWSHRRRTWQAALQDGVHASDPCPAWARSSVFSRRGALLLVTESFAPWLTRLPP